MKEEISKVLNLVKEGKLDSEKATDLITVLKEKEPAVTTEFLASNSNPEYLNKSLKIRVLSKDNDNVNVTLPIRLVKVFLKAGHSVASQIPASEKYVKDINIDMLIEAIDQELVGQIVDVKSANGDSVSVVIE